MSDSNYTVKYIASLMTWCGLSDHWPFCDVSQEGRWRNRELISRKAQSFSEDLWKRGDPWEFETSEFEHRRCARLLEILSGRRYANVLRSGVALESSPASSLPSQITWWPSTSRRLRLSAQGRHKRARDRSSSG